MRKAQPRNKLSPDPGSKSIPTPVRDTVVLIHGMWMTGLVMLLLQYHLRRCGFTVVRFSYPTVHCSLRDNATLLHKFLLSLDAETVHFVAHSLGGLLLRQFFHDYPDQRPGRVVTLGTPHRGSEAAMRLGRKYFGKALLGESYKNGLRGDVPAWDGSREMMVIAGDLSFSFFILVGQLSRPNDGTVAVAETTLATAKEHVVLPVTHMGLLISPRVASTICRFLA